VIISALFFPKLTIAAYLIGWLVLDVSGRQSSRNPSDTVPIHLRSTSINSEPDNLHPGAPRPADLPTTHER
jgi:hypothetical protein